VASKPVRPFSSKDAVVCRSVGKTWAEGTPRAHEALRGIDLDVAPNEFIALLGPSGCGKSTLLYLIAGLEAVSCGGIWSFGDPVEALSPERSLIFQSYALFPHRTVAENVAFGLRMRGLSRGDIADAVARALKQVALAGYELRRPAQLSGGEQQRVALARALVVRPPVLLCDEPLGALDRKLRQSMQFELKQLQKDLGVTLIFVTHDQEEAMAMADRIAVMNAGRIEQAGSPAEIYGRPRTRFVADFIGEINLFAGVWKDGAFQAASGASLPANGTSRMGDGTIAVRPERMRFVAAAEAVFSGTIESANYLGGHVLYRVAAGGAKLLVRETGALRPVGAQVGVSWSAADAVALED